MNIRTDYPKLARILLALKFAVQGLRDPNYSSTLLLQLKTSSSHYYWRTARALNKFLGILWDIYNTITDEEPLIMSKAQNGSAKFQKIPYKKLETTVVVDNEKPTTLLQYVVQILKSGIPYLVFLAFYLSNGKLHILAQNSDSDKVYNISNAEYSVLHFHPNVLISSHHFIALDFLAAVPYLIHYVLPILYPIYLVLKGAPEDIMKFYWLLGCFLWLQYVIWFFLPTAPPWYYDNQLRYQQDGLMPPMNEQHREGCAFRRVDETTGYRFFFKMFANNPVPYGAFPSGHVAWPTAICLTNPPLGGFCWLYVLYVAWATLYSCHHYLSDAVCAILLVVLVRKIVLACRRKQIQFGPLNKVRNCICPFNV